VQRVAIGPGVALGRISELDRERLGPTVHIRCGDCAA
jgi:hypothetical protein